MDTKYVYTPNPCGSGLARDEAGTFKIAVPDTPPSRASPLPQLIELSGRMQSNVGVSLLAMRPAHSTLRRLTLRHREQARSHS
ncbi:hypothetical protein EMIT0P294_170093 [Pseudomonas sp. IT-P294]